MQRRVAARLFAVYGPAGQGQAAGQGRLIRLLLYRALGDRTKRRRFAGMLANLRMIGNWMRPSQPLFILGAPRSGTTFLCCTLNQHRDIRLTNESRIFVLLKDFFEERCFRPDLLDREYREEFLRFARARSRPLGRVVLSRSPGNHAADLGRQAHDLWRSGVALRPCRGNSGAAAIRVVPSRHSRNPAEGEVHPHPPASLAGRHVHEAARMGSHRR